MSDEGIQILPFYLVADASLSMQADGKIDRLNELLPQLRDELVRNPVVGDMVRFGLLDFSDDATAWQQAYAALTDWNGETHEGFRLFPNLIPVGIGDCDRETLKAIRHRKEGDAAMPALFMADGGNPAKAIAELIPLLIRSIVNSSLAQAGAGDDQGAAAKAMADTLADAEGFDVELD